MDLGSNVKRCMESNGRKSAAHQRHEAVVGVSEVRSVTARDRTCQRLLRSTTTSAKHTMVSPGRGLFGMVWALIASVSPTQTPQKLSVLHLVSPNHLALPSGMSPCVVCDELEHSTTLPVRRRATGGTVSTKPNSTRAAGAGGSSNTMLKLYTDDSPGLRV